MTKKNRSRREFLAGGALVASGLLSGCVLSTDGLSPEGTDISELVSPRPAEGTSISVRSAEWFNDPIYGGQVEIEVGVHSRDGGEYWVRSAVVWDGATQSSDTETTTLVPGETAAIGLYQSASPDLDEIEDILVGGGPVASNENPFAQGDQR